VEKYSINFNDTIGAWQPRGGEGVTLESGHDNDNHYDYMVVGGRRAGWHGAQLNNSVLNLEKGHTYDFECYVQGDGGSNINNVMLKLDAINKDSNDKNQYIPIGSATVNTGTNQWQGNKITGNLTVPDYADVNNMYIYFEGDESGSPYDSFRVHNIKITESTVTNSAVSGNKDGYKIENGQYVSDYSNYGLTLDVNSVTNPLHLLGDGYVSDTGFEKEVILESANGWAYFWKNHDISTSDPHYISEDNNYLYQYHIEEVAILDSNGNPVNMDDYLITYSGNDVATNDADNPITVTNKYIWYKLPATGGSGTGRIYFFGFVLTVTGIISVSALYRRKRRRV
jgi:hypothetical protein